MRDRRPGLVWCVIVVAAVVALANLGALVGAARALRAFPLAQVVGQALVATLMLGVSGWFAIALGERKIHGRGLVSAYLWLVLLMEPVRNILRASGLHLPSVALAPQELAGAAIAEILRYLVLLTLIVWVMFSTALRADLAAGAPVARATNPPRSPPAAPNSPDQATAREEP